MDPSLDVEMEDAGVGTAETDHRRPLKHTRVCVAYDEARKVRLSCGKRVLEDSEINGPRVLTDPKTGAKRVLVYPWDMFHCDAMAEYFRSKRYAGPGFFDALNEKYTWTAKSDNKRGYFSRKRNDDDLDGHRDNQGLTEEHEGTVECLYVLTPKHLVGVVTVCSCAGHDAVMQALLQSGNKRRRRFHPSWAQGTPGLFEALPMSLGPRMQLKKGWRWHPDPKKRGYFVLDLAIVMGDKLICAIEVEHTHANSKKKRAYFKKYGILNVQISAKEVLDWLDGRDPEQITERLVVRHHPLTAKREHECLPCRKEEADQEKRRLVDQANAAAAAAAAAAAWAKAEAAAAEAVVDEADAADAMVLDEQGTLAAQALGHKIWEGRARRRSPGKLIWYNGGTVRRIEDKRCIQEWQEYPFTGNLHRHTIENMALTLGGKRSTQWYVDLFYEQRRLIQERWPEQVERETKRQCEKERLWVSRNPDKEVKWTCTGNSWVQSMNRFK